MINKRVDLRNLLRGNKDTIIAPLGLIALCIAAAIISPVFLKADNISSIMKQTPIALVLGIGMTLVIISGGIDLSVGASTALSGVILVQMRVIHGMPLPVAVLACVLVGTACGAFNGVLIVLGKLPPFIVTLGTVGIYQSACLIITQGVSSLSVKNELTWVANNTFLGIPLMFWGSLIVLLVGAYIMKYTVFGRHLYALGGNEESARFSGVKVRKVRFTAYLFNGIASGIAAIFLVSRLSSCPPTAGDGYELNAIAAAVIGGASLAGGEGTMFGTFIGALIMAVIMNLMNLLNVNSFYQKAVVGVIIILMVLTKNISNKNVGE